MIASKVEPRPVLKTSTPVRKPMPSTIASVLMTSRTLRASRLRSVSRNMLSPPRGVSRAMASRIESRSGSASSSTIRPSARNTTRSVYDAATGSWVTITIVWPNSSTLRRRKPSTSALLVLSRLPVGSSAKTIDGLADQRPGARDPLLLAARHLARPVAEPVAQPDGVDDLVEPGRVGLAAGEGQRQQDVLLRGQRRDQVERLEDEADPLPPQRGERLVLEPGQLDAVDDGLAAGRGVERGQAVHQRRLAGARGPHDGGELAGVEVDGHAVEGADLGLALAVDLHQVAGAGGGAGASRPRRLWSCPQRDVRTNAAAIGIRPEPDPEAHPEPAPAGANLQACG